MSITSVQRFFTLCIGVLIALPAHAEPVPEWVAESRAAAGTLASELQQALQSAMIEHGPIGAIDTCRLEAPAIAAAASTDSLSVGRTALKLRNPDNAPDAWERQVLLDFQQQQLANGADAAQLEAYVVELHTIESTTVESERGKTGSESKHRIGRWMRAIPTQPQCLVCHGSTIAPDVAAAIDRDYPNDEARGFRVGELRGAFTVRVELPRQPNRPAEE